MRLDLNLASQPYENVRAFLVRWTALLAALAVLSAALVWMASAGWLRSRDVARDMQVKKREIARLQQEEKQAQARMNLPQNRSVVEEAAYLNQLIAFKAFSWTEAFSEFERLMPGRIHVVSVHPQLTSENQLEITLMVAGDSRDKALELLRHMEDSRHFRDAMLLSETNDLQSGAISFQIYAVYVPTANASAAAAGAPAEGGR